MMLPSQTDPATTNNLLFVDLKLDDRLKPTPLHQFRKKSPPPAPSKSVVNVLKDGPSSAKFSHAAGSAKDGEFVHYRYASFGLFGAVYEAWLNHWALRTSPEDWWFPVALKVAKAVDRAAKFGRPSVFDPAALKIAKAINKAAKYGRSSGGDFDAIAWSRDGGHSFPFQGENEEVPIEEGRYQFGTTGVEYEKRDINIETDTVRIDYKKIFDSIKTQMCESIKIPEFIDAMENNFSTSTETHTIAAQINLMSCFQEYFNYKICVGGCGLKGLEMDGTVEDWEALAAKLKTVRKSLNPFDICYDYGLSDGWWDAVLNVFEMLAYTRKNPNDKKIPKLWLNILCNTKGEKWLGAGWSATNDKSTVEAPLYDGWLIKFLLGRDEIFAEDLHTKTIRERLCSWNQVPLTMTLTWHQPPIMDKCTLIAGIVGYKIHTGEQGNSNKENSNGDDVVPSVQPHHMWALLLRRNSPLQSHRLALDS